MEPIFYILFSEAAGKYYVGHTTEAIEEWVRKYNSNHSGYTVKFKDWRTVYIEMYASKEQAYRRELEVKSWKSKSRIEKLIGGSGHPAR
ncbi:MAG: GIY-YIG nuclease family protein [Bacteroidetes bacterium]|nr:GIY-YIG nuclease family protein [Bacteroidota bacterium]MBS1540502.1 GIY-YIG nuclease family protein [Bacteroidota bacterium]